MEFFQDNNNIHLVISFAIIVSALLLRWLAKRMVKRILMRYEFNSFRKSIISKIINITTFLIIAILILGIWEVDPDDLALYLASVFTIIGLAFFHQRSHLSNITAGLILFFNHPVKIGDQVSIYERENTFKGRIDDIGLFFVSLTTEEDEKIIISNTLFLQRLVSVK